MLYASRGEHQKALDHLNQALPLRRAERDSSGEGRTLGNIGLVFNAMHEREKALNYLSQAMRRYQAIANRSGEADMRYRIAQLQRAQGNETEARAEVEKALGIARVFTDWSIQSQSSRLLLCVNPDLLRVLY